MSSPPALAFEAAVFDCDGTLVETREQPLEPLEGVERLLRFLLEARLRLAVATNGPRAFIESVLGKRLGSFFEVLVPSEELDPPSDTGRTSTCERARS